MHILMSMARLDLTEEQQKVLDSIVKKEKMLKIAKSEIIDLTERVMFMEDVISDIEESLVVLLKYVEDNDLKRELMRMKFCHGLVRGL